MSKICIELLNGSKMNFELYDNIAPISVSNFLKLVDSKYFDNTIFHRVIEGFMCQGGGYYIENNTIKEKSRLDPIKGEFKSNGIDNPIVHELGVLSMARTNDPNSATSQFFICMERNGVAHLDGNYAAFGKILDDSSIQVLKTLNKYQTVSYGMAFADFPNTNLENFTIKSIYRI